MTWHYHPNPDGHPIWCDHCNEVFTGGYFVSHGILCERCVKLLVKLYEKAKEEK